MGEKKKRMKELEDTLLRAGKAPYQEYLQLPKVNTGCKVLTLCSWKPATQISLTQAIQGQRRGLCSFEFKWLPW